MSNGILQRVRHSLRHKLLLLTLLPLALTAVGFAMMAAYWTTSYSDRQLYMKVSADLSVAQGTLEIMQQEQLSTLNQLASSYEFRTNLLHQRDQALLQQLQEVQRSRDLSYLRMIPTEQLLTLNESSLRPLIEQLVTGESLASITVIPTAELQQISYGLGQQAQITLIDTPKATPTERVIEDRAMVLRALYPVTDDFNQIIGVLDAGVVFNNNNTVVDTIRDLVYGPGTLPTDGIGTVTIFLDDVRISTNVPQLTPEQVAGKELSFSQRAIGTRVSEEVRTHVLQFGQKWINRAFVVNDWYISAYQPLRDFDGKRIGMIYTGFTEAPFSRIYYKTLLEAALMIGLIMLVSGIVVFNNARALLRPLEKIHTVVKAVRDDKEHPRIGDLQSDDELSDLAKQFDAMLDLLETRNEQISRANNHLEAIVDQRTRSLRRRTEALKEHIRLLKSTRKQLLDKEKLAVLGELTAGIAHEINNPAAVILGNVDLIQAELGPDGDVVAEEVEMIVQQVYRIRSLINNLLQYSRPGQYTSSHESQNINQVIDDTLLLVRHALDKQQVTVCLDYNADSQVEINTQQIQQVLVNLILNAAHALDGPGIIEIRTQNWQPEDDNEVGSAVSVIDQGKGIDPTVAQQIFDPFFTTKESGTGLGLAISHGIVRRHGGDITVDSEPGRGTTFTVQLRHKVPAEGLQGDDALGGILDGLAQAERTNRRSLSEAD